MRQIPIRAVEGSRAWGFIEVPRAVRRSGWDRYQLVLYPPGITASQHRALSFNRQWPLWGALGALGCELAFGWIWPGAYGVLVLLIAYALGLGIGALLTAHTRRGIRRLVVAVTDIAGQVEVFGDKPLFQTSVERLDELDRGLRHERMTPAQYEAGWSEVYERLPRS